MKKLMASILIVAILIGLTGCGLLQQKPKGDTQSESTMQEEAQPEEAQEPADNKEDTDNGQQDPQVKKIKMKLYFANEDNSAVPYELREVEVRDLAVMKAAVEALLAGPEASGLRRAIPEGTKLIGINKKGNLAIVDFSGEFTKTNGVAEIVARVSVVNTLTEIQGIEKVKILVEGKDLIGPSGEPFGELERVALDSKGYPVPGEKKTITLYFANSNADKVVAEKREVGVTKGESMEKVIFRELAKGPQGKGLHPVIPEGTKLISAKTKDGVCTIDLSKEFVENNHGGTAGESMTVYSIVNSLTGLSGVKKVQFLVEGKKLEVYLHLVFDEPFPRNEGIIQK